MSISIREARKAAFHMAASMLESGDLESIFADLYSENAEDPISVENLTNAISWCVKRIRLQAGD